ncbi:MAG: pantothenate kinase [Flavobacteriales bacterium]|nr:type III pantothenate kinase [Bacteroidales bacterium AH-315-I05]PCJ82422.1 MAG: pantothenate kinase [Flavobacteriales bacterium]
MNLVIDIGNSTGKVAVFDKSDLLESCLFNNEITANDLQEIFGKHPKINRAILCSVTNYSDEISNFLDEKTSFIILSEKTSIPIKIRYETPQTLGKDRLAAAVGSNHLFPSQNLLVIDAGTTITYEFINDKNEYAGGGISPGIDMRLKSLNHFTGKLPLIQRKDSSQLIGLTTEESILSGVINGAVAEVKGIIHQYESKFENLQVVLTGGDTKVFEKALESGIFAAPHLVLTGLNIILNYND